jgi:DHA1 family bicyclomycin/chloramphenicol resistance-like MFS transporter
VFVSLAPFVMVGILGLPTDEFGLYYLFLATGFFIGNLLVSRSGGHHDVARQVNAGLGWQLAGACAALAMVLMGFRHPLAVFVPMTAFCFGQGLALPNLIAHGIRLAPKHTGVASSMFGFSPLALAALAVQIMGFVPARGWQPALWFCVCGAVFSAVGVKRLETSEDSPTSA